MASSEEVKTSEEELRMKILELQKTNEELQRRLNDQLLFEQMMTLHYKKEKDLAKQLQETSRKLEEVNEELKRKDRIKDEFVSIASHELRTPVQSILGFADLAKENLIDQHEAWNGVIEAALRLQKVAKDILDVSRIQSGQLSYNISPFGINELILSIVNSVRPVLNSKQSLETNLDEEIAIEADKARITQVLGNIMSNAIKFTKEGKIKVQTHSLLEQNKIEISITDSGPGIHPDILPNLFGKFVSRDVQGDNQHGTGLGLFICKGIITAHNGQITAYNNDEGGATFKIVLPIYNSTPEGDDKSGSVQVIRSS